MKISWDQKKLIFDKVGYEPTEGQLQIHKIDSRIKLIAGGERSGKSTVSAMELVGQFWLGDTYWLVGADYELCREEFKFLVDSFKKLGAVDLKNIHFPSRDQCSMDLAGGIHIETKSAKYPERLAAVAPSGIIMCEAAQMDYEIFLRCLGRLAEKRGWLVMAGTFETSLDFFADKFREYQTGDNSEGGVSFSLPSWSNTYCYKGGYNNPEIQRMLSIYGKERFSERFVGKPMRPRGLVFSEFKSILHTGHFPLDPGLDVFLGVDPGYHPGVYAVLAIQFINDEIYVVDELYEQHLITDQVIDIIQAKPYWQRVAGGAIDIEAKHIHGQKPIISIWQNKGKLSLDMKYVLIEDGIARLRTFLLPHPITGQAKIHIDSRCRGLISEFGGCKSPPNIEQGGAYKYRMNIKGEALSEKPKDECNHAIKALIYAIVAKYGLAPKARGPMVVSPQYY